MLDAEFKANSDSIKTIIVTYNWQKNNKINGSLFYCFEHFLFYKKYGYDCILTIVGIPFEDIKRVEAAYKDKYQEKYVDQIQDGIRYYQSVAKWAQKNDEHHIHVILDIFTLNKVQIFIQKNQKFVYVNNDYSNHLTQCPIFSCKQILNTNWFWYYDYQYLPDFKNRIKTPLRLGLEFQKKCEIQNESDLKIFVSAPVNCPDKYIPINDDSFIVKSPFNIIPDLFNKIYSVIVLHVGLDTNNRIIPEAYYHGKKVRVDNYYLNQDSVNHRNKLGILGKLDEITLSTDCKMFQKVIDCYNN